jgi:hypothetical protein
MPFSLQFVARINQYYAPVPNAKINRLWHAGSAERVFNPVIGSHIPILKASILRIFEPPPEFLVLFIARRYNEKHFYGYVSGSMRYSKPFKVFGKFICHDGIVIPYAGCKQRLSS